MANEERVVLIAEVRDEATADLGNINRAVDDTTRKVEDSGKRTEKSTSRSTTAFERFSSGGSKAFERFSGGMRGNLDKAMGSLSSFGDRVAESDTVIGRMVRGGRRGLQDFASGFKSPMAAASSFTGLMGDLGGAARSGLDSVKGVAQNIGTAFEDAITRVGDLGERMQEIGPRISGIGGTLTKSITLPAAGAAAAAAGITAKLGWDRLTSLDTAQSQLRGLGYEGEDVERITGNLVDTLEGGMMTMGEGTSTAAGALAAGVEEGAELERYIQLVDAAAVGMGRSVDETAMIFGRVQGSGRMMTQELNMIEESMPGFSAALADNLDVGQDALGEMVTAGEIDSDRFLDVMDDFAGGMATEYAKSWEGMVVNTKNYVGIIGESLLGGVFEQSKESIGEFVDFLASDEVAAWAEDVGARIGDAFDTVIGWVQSAIEWWTGLDDSTKSLIGIIAGIAVVIGPVLIAIGTTISIVGKLMGTLTFLLNPITWIIAGIAALVAGLTWFFTQTEIGQKIISTAWEWIQSAVAAVVDWFQDTALPVLQSVWEGIASGATWLWEEVLQPTWEWIKDAASAVVDWFTETALPALEAVWDGIAVAAMWLWEEVLQPVFEWIAEAWDNWTSHAAWAWENVLKPAWDAIEVAALWLWEEALQPVFNWIGDAWDSMVGGIAWAWEEVLKPAWGAIESAAMWLWEEVLDPVFGWISDKWSNIMDSIQDLWETIGEPVFGAISDLLQGDFIGAWENARDAVSGIWEKVMDVAAVPIDFVIDTVYNKGIREVFNAIGGIIGIDPLTEFDTVRDSMPSMPSFADGGLAAPGWAMVGEEGPELVNFSQPGRVYTADETRSMLTGGAEGVMPMGGGGGNRGSIMGSSLDDRIEGREDSQSTFGALDWVRGKLADTAATIINPLQDYVDRELGGPGFSGWISMAATGLMDDALDWIRGKDDDYNASTSAGSYDGEFTANPGGFNRPMAGMITSRAGSRSYTGAFGNMHYGVDIGNSIGSAVRAAWSGVVKSISGSGMDQTVVLNHGSYDTAYMHNSEILKSLGTEVTGGEQIARSGTAGSGPHLHFEIHPGGYYNPSIDRVNELFGLGAGNTAGGAAGSILRDNGGPIPTGTSVLQNNSGAYEFAVNSGQFGQMVDVLDYVAANIPMPAGGAGGGSGPGHVDQRDYSTTLTIESGGVTLAAGADGRPTQEGLDWFKEWLEETLEESARRDY